MIRHERKPLGIRQATAASWDGLAFGGIDSVFEFLGGFAWSGPAGAWVLTRLQVKLAREEPMTRPTNARPRSRLYHDRGRPPNQEASSSAAVGVWRAFAGLPMKIDLETARYYCGLGDIVMLGWLAEGCKTRPADRLVFHRTRDLEL